MRVGYFGPEGTFTHEALIAALPGSEQTLVPLPTIYDTVMAVDSGLVERALVPIENSLEGSVDATLDALAIETDAVVIVGEVVHQIQHCLIARSELELGEIETVVSHQQATAQCARFIRTKLPQATVLAGASTAEAVRIVAEHSGPWAALGNRLAAELYGCRVLYAGVEDAADNETRFVWLAKGGRRRRGRALARSPEDRRGLLGRGRRGGRVARRLPDRALRARRQPHADRVAAAQAGTWELHVLRRSRGRIAPSVASRTLSRRLKDEFRRSACWARSRRRRALARRSLTPARQGDPAHCLATLAPPMTTSVPAPAGSVPLTEHQRRGREGGRVLVLNATYEPINVCTVRRAVVLLLKDKAEVIEHGEWDLHSETRRFTVPS